MATCSENQKKAKNTECGEDKELFDVKLRATY
jgi:hypothetical protein